MPAFRHASEAKARAQDLATSISAVLVSEACNTGLEPMIRPEIEGSVQRSFGHSALTPVALERTEPDFRV